MTLELGQWSELEVAEKLRNEVEAERLTRLDRMLIALYPKPASVSSAVVKASGASGGRLWPAPSTIRR